MQARWFQARRKKMRIVEHDVLDPGFGQRARQTWLPDPLRDPCATRGFSPMLSEVIRQLAYLRRLIAVRNGRQNRLIVASAQKLYLTAPSNSRS